MGFPETLLRLSAVELAQLYRQRDLSPVEVIRTVLARSVQRQADLNAFAFLDEAGALAAARAAEQRFQAGEPLGALDGIPISVKDLLDVRGVVTRHGSLSTAHHPPAESDAPAAARIREQGAVIFAKTATHEFGQGSFNNPYTGITRNPWNLDRTPGGSSSGAVAAVAAGLGPLALGTDGGGSIRIPSAYTGLVGFKPSYGWVAASPPSVIGLPPLVGPIATTVADAMLLFRAIAVQDVRDPFSLPAPWRTQYDKPLRDWHQVRVAFAPSVTQEAVPDDILAAFDAAVAVFARLGALVQPGAPPPPPAGQHVLAWARAALAVRGLSAAQRAQLDPRLERTAREGERLSALDYVAAEAARATYAADVDAFFTSVDLFVTPTSPQVAPRIDPTVPPPPPPGSNSFSLSRHPAISVPCGLSREHLPIGLQIVGRRYEDEFVLASAQAFETSAEHLQDFRLRALALRA
jgi:aspartyl-tRNA(Asn)/glutamyl-tRNA(Gln) amidotransferase subunit A